MIVIYIHSIFTNKQNKKHARDANVSLLCADRTRLGWFAFIRINYAPQLSRCTALHHNMRDDDKQVFRGWCVWSELGVVAVVSPVHFYCWRVCVCVYVHKGVKCGRYPHPTQHHCLNNCVDVNAHFVWFCENNLLAVKRSHVNFVAYVSCIMAVGK